ncbi:MAG TPA: DUF1269 domain-containing protein [Jatrophihabitans sp.]|nr:DUF1269 domain-containing protein [Jatrophihabitans sp.]
MATMTVWKFPSPEGAEAAEDTLLELQKEGLIKIEDAAVVSYPEGARKPKTKQLHSVGSSGALGGAFWGMLFGLIFFVPLLGAAIGAGIGALAGSLVDVGIDDDFIKRVRAEIKPGTSALFLLSSDAVMDKVHERFANTPMTLVETNLSHDQEKNLQEVFSA